MTEDAFFALGATKPPFMCLPLSINIQGRTTRTRVLKWPQANDGIQIWGFVNWSVLSNFTNLASSFGLRWRPESLSLPWECKIWFSFLIFIITHFHSAPVFSMLLRSWACFHHGGINSSQCFNVTLSNTYIKPVLFMNCSSVSVNFSQKLMVYHQKSIF